MTSFVWTIAVVVKVSFAFLYFFVLIVIYNIM